MNIIKFLIGSFAFALLLSCTLYNSNTFGEATSSKIQSFYKRFLQGTGDISLPPNSFSIGALFDVYYEFSPQESITMAIKFKVPNQYFSVGLGTSMFGSDIWVFDIINSEIQATDCVGIGHTVPPLDTDQGGQNNLQVLGFEITPSYSLIKFTRPLNTHDPNDQVISPGPTNIIWATGPATNMVYHGAARGAITVDLVKSSAPSTQTYGLGESATVYSNTIKWHSILNAVAWLILSDIAVIIVRLFRGRKFVIPIQIIHAVIMLIVIIMSVVVTALALKEFLADNGGSKTTGIKKQDFHYINGLVIFFLILVALLAGIVLLVLLSRHKKSQTATAVFKRMHQIFGYLLYLDAKANIITGVLLYDTNQWKIPVFIYLGVLLLVHIIVQLVISLSYKYSNLKFNPPSSITKSSLTKRQAELLTAINSGESREALMQKLKNMKWVILGNSIFDLTDWIHPGGNFIIQDCVGKEVGRYFYGNFALEGSRMKPHKHSAVAFAHLTSSYIGELTNYESILVSKESQKEMISEHHQKWKIVSIKPISDTVGQVCFESSKVHVKMFGTSLSWLGRHFRVSFNKRSSIARLYTTALALSEAHIYLRQNIYNYFDDVMAGNEAQHFKYNPDFSSYHPESLPLFIKNYKNLKKGLSRKIHKIDILHQKNDFRIEGPYGTGLEFTPSTTGSVCIICAGTGLLPFVDFLALFLWKNMYDLLKEKVGIEKAQEINVLDIPFDSFFNGLKVTFLGSFADESEVLGLDIIKKLAEISKRYGLNNFTAIMKGCSHEHISKVQERFTQDFFAKTLNLNEDKYLIVGPPRFSNDVLNNLSKLGVPKNKLTFI